MSEFSRMIDLRDIGDRPVLLKANEAECPALAERFAIPLVERLSATIALTPIGDAVQADGQVTADIVQDCAVSGEPFAVHIDEPLSLRFVPVGIRKKAGADEIIELDAGDLDDIEFSGTAFDLGEAVAQTLALAIDPYAEGPHADRARKDAGLDDTAVRGPMADMLAALGKGTAKR